jgi:hypothetical protein
MAVAFTNLPGVIPELKDQGLAVNPPVRGLRTLVLGTAGQGQSSWPYVVGSSSAAASTFGSEGTLTRGMWEARGAGAQNVIMYRIGSTPAILEGVGDSTGVGGYKVETLRRDADAGSIYSIYYDDTSDRLVVWNTQSGLTVYDNDDTDPVDLGEVVVSGSRGASGGPDIAGPSVGIALEDVVGAGHTGTSFTAGTDGTSPSRMELYEYYHDAYKALLGKDFDFVIPMDVYVDDKNIVDGYSFSASYLASISGGDDYPTADSDDDILGKVYIEEYRGKDYFFWDLNGDGVADLYPTVGAASSTTKIDGNGLTTADFHEANFGYQCARFCHEISVNNRFCLSSIGMRPPASLSLEDVAVWIGKAPTYTTRSDGTQYIARLQDNGTGLLGNKFKAGAYGFRSGEAYGGFILTDGRFLDGTEETDSGGELIDIGRYISVVPSFVRLFNAFDSTGRGYIASFAATYLGFVSSLDEQVAPTNKVIRGVQRSVEISPRKIDELAGMGYVYVYEKPKGMTIADAPTGSRPGSDYRRLTTMRIVKRTVGAVRAASDPFLGNSFDAARKAALRTAITSRLDRLVQGGYIQRHELDIRQTATQMVSGTADVELIIVPAWELRRISLTVALAPQ